MRNGARLTAIFLLGAIVCVADGAPAGARLLRVGPGQEFALPSEAAAIVRSGDRVLIAPGRYVDCAVWPAVRSLTIEGTGDGVIIAEKSCENKALFVIQGRNVTVRRVTFTGAVVPNHNGAGIRAEGANLTVENSRFIGNEEGILAGSVPQARIVVRNSLFRDNGNCIADCSHGIYVGRIAELRIERSRFIEQHVGHHVKSRAERTELFGNEIIDGPSGTASYLVDIPDGGTLIMRDNRLQKGPQASNHAAAVSVAAEGNRNPTGQILIVNNRFTNDMAMPTSFVRNLTATKATLRGNRFTGDITPLDEPGASK